MTSNLYRNGKTCFYTNLIKMLNNYNKPFNLNYDNFDDTKIIRLLLPFLLFFKCFCNAVAFFYGHANKAHCCCWSRVGARVCRVVSRMLVERALSPLSSDRLFFNSFASTDKTKNMTNGTIVATGSCIV